MPEQSYDVVVVGGGTAGFAAARTAARSGASVALIEANILGGECPNTACVPTKALLASAGILEETQHGAPFGVHCPRLRGEFGEAVRREQQVVQAGGSETDVERRLQSQGIRVARGRAQLLSDRLLAVDGDRLRAERIILCTGTTDSPPPVAGLAEIGYLTHKEAILLPSAPDSLAILGGGPVGVEFAQIFAPFGTKVTLIERNFCALSKEDQEITDTICNYLRQAGITVDTHVTITRAVRRHGLKVLQGTRCGHPYEVAAEEVLSAVGHQPALEDMGLERAGVEWDGGGIRVDDTLRTHSPRVWAAGDCTGIAHYTHVAAYQGRLAARNALSDNPLPADHRVVPRVTFTRPEVASVGLTEAQARESYRNVRAGRIDLAEIEKARIEGEQRGMAKLVLGEDDRILGAHIIAPRAGELIHEPALAMAAGIPARQMGAMMHAFPTFSEIWEALLLRMH
ncbi:MAG: NAD(P)/FAD-dependent oxidoreductase [Armatimonadetes bacterium]|nr:NAD(P)/FAD-dependent oxidoreductase [Armatimonadota bacterium]